LRRAHDIEVVDLGQQRGCYGLVAEALTAFADFVDTMR